MTRLFLSAILLAFYGAALAQPTITGSEAWPAAGTSFPVTTASASGGPGAAGANVTWDLSALGTGGFGSIEYVAPSSTPMASSFSSANYAWRVTTVGPLLYSFFRTSGGKLEDMASTIQNTSSGNNYSLNPKTLLVFPWTFNASAVDTYQKVGTFTPNTVTVTYDGWGTLKTPGGTYTDVVRTKEDYGSGGVDYRWYLTTPTFRPVMILDHNVNLFYFIDNQPAGVDEAGVGAGLQCWPNPAGDEVVVAVPGAGHRGNAVLTLTDLAGRVVYSTADVKAETRVPRGMLAAGVYALRLMAEGRAVGTARVVFQ